MGTMVNNSPTNTMAKTENKPSKARKVIITKADGTEEICKSIHEAAKSLNMHAPHLYKYVMGLVGQPKALKEQNITVQLLNPMKWVNGAPVEQ